MLDVLLVNPPYSFTDLVTLKKKKKSRGFYLKYPHLGLGYIASSTLAAGYSVKLIDASAAEMTMSEILLVIKKEQPKVLGITSTIQTSKSVYALIKKVKKLPEVPIIVVGGPHVSALPETIDWFNIKYGFINEGEVGFVKLLKYIFEKKGTLSKIEGLVYKEKGKLKVNPNVPIKDLDKLPFPARSLMENDKYFSPVHSGRITSMLLSRGCPFNCTYCSRPAIGRIWRYRSPSNIFEEIKQAVEIYKVSYVEFVDDTLTIDKKRIEKLCDLIIKSGLKIAWGCQTRADMIDFPLLKKMKRAGCEKMSFGLETGVQKIRYQLNKRITNQSYGRTMKWCTKLGIETNTFVMFGHPGESLKDMKESIAFVKKLDPDYAAFYITTILPGSILGEWSRLEGRIKPDVWKKYIYGKANLPPYIPKGLSMEDLENMHRKAFREFYLRPKYIINRILKIRSWAYLLNTATSALTVIKDYIVPNGINRRRSDTL